MQENQSTTNTFNQELRNTYSHTSESISEYDSLTEEQIQQILNDKSKLLDTYISRSDLSWNAASVKEVSNAAKDIKSATEALGKKGYDKREMARVVANMNYKLKLLKNKISESRTTNNTNANQKSQDKTYVSQYSIKIEHRGVEFYNQLKSVDISSHLASQLNLMGKVVQSDYTPNSEKDFIELENEFKVMLNVVKAREEEGYVQTINMFGRHYISLKKQLESAKLNAKEVKKDFSRVPTDVKESATADHIVALVEQVVSSGINGNLNYVSLLEDVGQSLQTALQAVAENSQTNEKAHISVPKAGKIKILLGILRNDSKEIAKAYGLSTSREYQDPKRKDDILNMTKGDLVKEIGGIVSKRDPQDHCLLVGKNYYSGFNYIPAVIVLEMLSLLQISDETNRKLAKEKAKNVKLTEENKRLKGITKNAVSVAAVAVGRAKTLEDAVKQYSNQKRLATLNGYNDRFYN